MQYFKPAEENTYFGDAMPFFDGRRFHLYYLPAVYNAEGRLQGHDWAHLSSADLSNWQTHPVALDRRAFGVGGFGTGSVYQHGSRCLAFYSTGCNDGAATRVGCAGSEDGITFRDCADARFPDSATIAARGYRQVHYRDPCVIRDPASGLHHMVVTSAQMPGFDGSLYPFGGCLAHLTSPDLSDWTLHEPFMKTGHKGAPECPDLFHWKGWYYLLFSNEGATRYRMARSLSGPWMRPEHDLLTSEMERVMKTAAFHGNRRIGVAFAPDMRDGVPHYGGRAVFRELLQDEDGTLSVTWPAELQPETGRRCIPPVDVTLRSPLGFASERLGCLPERARLRMRIEPAGRGCEFGLLLKGNETGEALELVFVPGQNRIALRDTMKRWSVSRNYTINAARVRTPLDAPFTCEIVLREDLLDIVIDGRQGFLATFPRFDNPGACFAFALDSQVAFRGLEASA